MAYAPTGGYAQEVYNGDKFFNGFGLTKDFVVDYYELRARSAQLFRENLYARGLIRRLVTNEINTGLTPEVIPNEKLLDLPEDSLGDWSEDVEDLFALWADDKNLCDTTRLSDFGKIQRIVRAEALISGDVLVIMRLDRATALPRIQVVSAVNVVTPVAGELSKLPAVASTSRIVHGVELNQFNQQVAYYIRQLDGSIVRIPARGLKSGRVVSWLVYGTDKLLDEVRGEPLLSIILQSLKEIDRYRDAVQRKAAINAMLAMFIKKTQDKMGTKPITNGAVLKQNMAQTSEDGVVRKYNIANHIPGLVIEDLQTGEEPVAFGNQGTDTSFSEFEAALIHAIAWANEIPPEILQLAFASNYSASQAAINEFKNYLNKIRAEFGATFCKPIYQEWLFSSVLTQKVEAAGLIEAWTDPLQYIIKGAWTASEWSGAIKPSTDIKKQAEGYERMVGNGWMTNDRASKELTGTKYSRNIRTLRRENEAKSQAGLGICGADMAVPETSGDEDSESDNVDGDVSNNVEGD